MHVTTKDVVGTDDDAKKYNLPVGANILTTVLESDSALPLCSEKAILSAKVLSTSRTVSGGIQLQVAVLASEPANVPVSAPAPAEDPKFLEAVEYFVGKGLSDSDARKKVNQFGVVRVLAAKSKELDDELSALVAKEPPIA